jgi:hypothetical protein
MATPLGRQSLLPVALLCGCTFHSIATEWHERTGIDGQPVRLMTTTIVGFNLLVLLPVPFLGDPRVTTLVDAATERLAREGANRLRVVETESSNYWFALPPLSWFVSPVIGSISIEFEPAPLPAPPPEPAPAAPAVAEPNR